MGKDKSNFKDNPLALEHREDLNNLFRKAGIKKPIYFDRLANDFKDRSMVKFIFLWAKLYVLGEMNIAEIRKEHSLLRTTIKTKQKNDLKDKSKPWIKIISANMRD